MRNADAARAQAAADRATAVHLYVQVGRGQLPAVSRSLLAARELLGFHADKRAILEGLRFSTTSRLRVAHRFSTSRAPCLGGAEIAASCRLTSWDGTLPCMSRRYLEPRARCSFRDICMADNGSGILDTAAMEEQLLSDPCRRSHSLCRGKAAPAPASLASVAGASQQLAAPEAQMLEEQNREHTTPCKAQAPGGVSMLEGLSFQRLREEGR